MNNSKMNEKGSLSQIHCQIHKFTVLKRALKNEKVWMLFEHLR